MKDADGRQRTAIRGGRYRRASVLRRSRIARRDSGPAGYWGGNLDYNFIREGVTVLLPVFHRGGLLFFGDGHALQADGEAVGSGLETSLDVEVTVRLRKRQKLTGLRVETAEWIVSVHARHAAVAHRRARPERTGGAPADWNEGAV